MDRGLKKCTFLVVACCMLAGLSGPAAASEATDLLFQDDQLADVASGATLRYDHRREVNLGADLPPIEEGAVTLTFEEGEGGKRSALVRMSEGKRQRLLDPFPGRAGNPVLMVFLESSLRSMAKLTGGSPFYIRNRIKDALRAGGAVDQVEASLDGASVAAQEVRLRPFEDDPNRDRMGAFADLEISFVVSQAAPGGFLRFAAETPEDAEGQVAYREEMILDSLGKGQ